MMNNICHKCTGCMSCYYSCPHHAIQLSISAEGFYIPRIDKNKCTNCGLCKEICPQNNTPELSAPIKAFAVKGSDEIRKKSSSGGIFGILAEYIFSVGGIVCGAAFSKDFKKVEHIIINDRKDLYKLQGSKYLQSDISNNIYNTIKKNLENGVYVLFSGTPCQVAGLKSYLKKDYCNLLLVDILCHGTPSPKVWSDYLDSISDGKKIKNVNFRNKKYGWGFNHTLTVEYADNTEYRETAKQSLYYKAFLLDLILNKSCSECKYAAYSRAGDITLGDFWNVYNYDNSIDDKKGISVVLINSIKGQKIFNNCKQKFIYLQELSAEEAKGGNSILEHPFKAHHNRKTFFEKINSNNIINNITQCLSKKYDGIIANCWWSNNFGALISSYAVQQFFKENGFNYYVLNYDPYNNVFPIFNSFIEDYMLLTHKVNNEQDFIELNNCTKNFAVGTDQVFRYEYVKDILPVYTLSYTHLNKKRIAFSASFGKAEFDEANKEEKREMKVFLNRFQAISTREKSGVKLCKDNFNIKAEHIIDPIFFLEHEKWDKIISGVESEVSPIVAYILDTNEMTEKLCNKASEKLNAKITNLSYENTTAEGFIYAIKNSEYVITDSFHGTCLAIIFNKPFICLKNKDRGGERFNSIQDLFNIKLGFIDKETEIDDISKLFADYNYSDVQNIITQEKEKAKAWLLKSVNKKDISLRILINEPIFQMIKLNNRIKRIIREVGRFKEVSKTFVKNLVNITITKIKQYKYKFSQKMYLKTKEFKLLKSIYFTKDKILLWGASIFLEDFIKKYCIQTDKIMGIIDKNPKKHGTKLGKYNIYSPNEISAFDTQKIIVTIINSPQKRKAEIKQFLSKNYKKDVILKGL